jgi:hypothetical protein
MDLFFQHIDKETKFFFLKIFTILILKIGIVLPKIFKNMLEKHLQFE